MNSCTSSQQVIYTLHFQKLYCSGLEGKKTMLSAKLEIYPVITLLTEYTETHIFHMSIDDFTVMSVFFEDSSPKGKINACR